MEKVTFKHKTVEDYAADFIKDYQKIVPKLNNNMLSNNNLFTQYFDVLTTFTDKTPVVASNSTIIISK